METSDYAGELPERGQYVRKLVLRGQTPAYVCNWLANTKPLAFYALVKAIARNNKSVEDQILRSWRIRRLDVEAALPRDNFWPAELLSWQNFARSKDETASVEYVLRSMPADR